MARRLISIMRKAGLSRQRQAIVLSMRWKWVILGTMIRRNVCRRALSKDARDDVERFESLFSKMTGAYQNLCEYLATDVKKCPLNEFFTDLKSFCMLFLRCLQEYRLWRGQEEKRNSSCPRPCDRANVCGTFELTTLQWEFDRTMLDMTDGEREWGQRTDERKKQRERRSVISMHS